MPPESLDLVGHVTGWWRLTPEIALATGSALLLVYEAFAKPSNGRRPALIAAGVVLVALVLTLTVPLSGATAVFREMAVVDPFVQYFRVLFSVAALFGLLLAWRSNEIRARTAPEYYALFLALVFGMMLMASAADFIMLMIALEIVSLMSYILAGFRRGHAKSAEAALKYVIYGGAASGAMFFGFSILYGLTGHTHFSLIHEALRAAVPKGPELVALSAAVALIFAGLGYKVAAVPMHMWSPDVYEGAPTPFTAFLSTGPKAAGFAAMIRFFYVTFADHTEGANLLSDITSFPWIYLIIASAVLTMTIGNLAAIGQRNIKRFLAYSSIAHAGYLLIGVAAFSQAAISAVLIYLAFYVVMNLGAFYVVIWVRERTGHELIEDYKGLGRRAPLVAVVLTLCLFSLTGLPPLAGFIGKYYIFAAALERGAEMGPALACSPELRETMGLLSRIGCSIASGGVFYALAIIGALNSAISLFYYARVIRKMFLENAADESPIPVDASARLVLIPVALFLVVFGVYWGPLKSAADRASLIHRPLVESRADSTTAQRTPSSAANGSTASVSARARVPHDEYGQAQVAR
ncbi:MAG: NADH-quinone oxidoreductase subunit N [Deltaproteobacteria bacterium]|nr:NADH-quinone oxidoreductase subunit N [Deltaproteobacteria bacterium]